MQGSGVESKGLEKATRGKSKLLVQLPAWLDAD